MILTSPKKPIYLRPLELSDTEALLNLRLANREALRTLDPIREEAFYTLEVQRLQIVKAISDFENDIAYIFGLFQAPEDRLVGRIALGNIIRGAGQYGTLGYFLDKDLYGHGFMTEGVRLTIDFAFGPAALHRVEAGVMPRNVPSQKVLEKNGFRREGLALRYIQINGIWEDHILYGITKEEWASS